MDYEKLSKEVSLALRHAPWEYELEMDDEGWVLVEQLLHSLNSTYVWEKVRVEDLEKMIDCSEKKRHEIVDGKIRAFYGHSIPMKIQKEERKPPEILYHGTAQQFLSSIMQYGLLPQARQYVHLSQDIETAKIVGKRRNSKPIILKINAEVANKKGIKFYFGNEKVWLANNIPSEFIEKL